MGISGDLLVPPLHELLVIPFSSIIGWNLKVVDNKAIECRIVERVYSGCPCRSVREVEVKLH